jgi:hypothetical protein
MKLTFERKIFNFLLALMLMSNMLNSTHLESIDLEGQDVRSLIFIKIFYF